MERARRARPLSNPGLRRADVHGVGGRLGRQSGRAPHPRRGHGEVHAVFGTVSMKIKVLYLASLREQLGKSGEDLEIPPATSTVAGLPALLMARRGAWQAALAQGKALRVAVNPEMAQPAPAVRPAAEIAFFPPVTGGAHADAHPAAGF